MILKLEAEVDSDLFIIAFELKMSEVVVKLKAKMEGCTRSLPPRVWQYGVLSYVNC